MSVDPESLPGPDHEDLDDDFSDFRGHKVVDEKAELPTASTPPQPVPQQPQPPAQGGTGDGG